MNARVYQVIAPDGGGTAEQFVQTLHGMLRPVLQRILEGQLGVALEMGGAEGSARFYVWVPDAALGFVTNLLRAAYEGVELRAMADPLEEDGWNALGYLTLAKFSHYPIATDGDGDVLSSLFSTLAETRDEERIHVSIVVAPQANRWQKSSHKEAAWLRSQRDDNPPLLATETKSPSRAFDLERARLLEEKARHLGFLVSIHLAVKAAPERADALLQEVAACFRTFSGHNSFTLRPVRRPGRAQRFLEGVRRRRLLRSHTLTVPEIAALWHLPQQAPFHVETITSPKLPPPLDLPNDGICLGMTNFAGRVRPVYLTVEDGRRHLHVMAPTGVGKTTALLNVALQHIEAGRALVVLDAKGDLVQRILERLPRRRIDDLVLLTPDFRDTSIGLNPLEWEDPDERDLIVESVLSIFQRIYAEFWGPRTDELLKAALYTLLVRPDATLCQIPLLLTDEGFRAQKLREVDDPILLNFWRRFEAMDKRFRNEVIAPLSNKLTDFLFRRNLRRILCQPASSIDLDHIVNHNGIFLADLAFGKWEEQPAALLGSFLFLKVWREVRRRAATIPDEAQRPDVAMLVDEFQAFVGVAGSFADTLAQARSFRLSLVLSHQDISQLKDEELRKGVFSNARSRMIFQCGPDDARYLARELTPLDTEALLNLGRYEVAMRLSVDSETSRPFTAMTLPAPDPTDASVAQEAALRSQERYGRPVGPIDEAIAALYVLRRQQQHGRRDKR